MKRNVYLKTVDLQSAQSILYQFPQILQDEHVPVKESLHRITSDIVHAKMSSPSYNASAMDGVAIIARDTLQATESTPVVIPKDRFCYINTGNSIPPQYDAVVMIEDVHPQKDGSIVIYKSVRSYQDIRPIGEDLVAGDPLLKRYHSIRPIDIAAMLSGGLKTVSVLQQMTVAIIPTGDEIVDDVDHIETGSIIDSNSYYLFHELENLHTKPTILPIQADEYETLKVMILEAANTYDLVLVGAGSSAGSKDFVKQIVEELGEVSIHGISIKPGKPTIIGRIGKTPIIGVPGYPVSTYIAFEKVIKPLVKHLHHQLMEEPQTIQARLTQKVYSSLKHEEFVRMKLGYMNQQYVTTPLHRGAGITMSVVDADGILTIPKHSEGYDSGTIVEIQLLTDIKNIQSALVVIGSHDIILNKISDYLLPYGTHLSSTHVGSFGGVLAMKSQGAHIAPVHILGENGEYNTFLISKYLDDRYCLIRGVERTQGFYVKKGNPKNIHTLHDLTRDDVTFVNRQKSSGTRILFDYLLQKVEINPNTIHGYDFELSTHTLIASSVLNERFDVGMGIESVAHLYDLDFIPLGQEDYDFIVPKAIMDTPQIQAFINVLKSTTFEQYINTTEGYHGTAIGDFKTKE